MKSLLDELRGLFQASDAPLRARVAAGLEEERRKKAARAWACEALPFTVEALKAAAAKGAERAELVPGSTALPRRLRRFPMGGLEELARLLVAKGLDAKSGQRGLVISWE